MTEYRDAPLKCPACAEMMEERVLSGSTVDTCPKCRGLWVDWFDGELLSVIKETAPLSMRPPIAIDPTMAICPRCAQPLTVETFGNAIMLLRCADCAGCYVPRASFTALMELDLPAHSVHSADVEKQGAFTRLRSTIRKLFHAEPTVKLGGNFRAHYDLAVAYHDKGLDGDAIDELHTALAMEPGNSDAEALLQKLTRK